MLKWVSKDNLITFWNEIRENIAGVVVEEVNEILGPTVEPMIDAAKDAVLGNLGTVESSSQASQNYSEGKYLVHNKNFYKVTSIIASGDTLEEGTNIEQTTVGDEIRAVGRNTTIVLNEDIPTTGTDNWTLMSHNVDLSIYDRVYVDCFIFSADLGNSTEVAVSLLPSTCTANQPAPRVSSFWTYNNLGGVMLSKTKISVYAKTCNFNFFYRVIGIR